MLDAGVQVAEQPLLVPVPVLRVHTAGIPDGSVPLKVIVPVAFTLYPESLFVTVAVQDSEFPE